MDLEKTKMKLEKIEKLVTMAATLCKISEENFEKMSKLVEKIDKDETIIDKVSKLIDEVDKDNTIIKN